MPKSSQRRISAAMAAFSAAVSFVFLYVASPNSPVYGTNISVDANAIFTVGRAWANGAVIYKDIFEQKGPLLYLINMLAAKISMTSFTGVFVFEVVAFAVTLFFAYKMLSLYANPAWSLPVLPLFMAAMCNSLSYAGANTAEEFCVPMLAFLLYSLLSYYKNGYPGRMSYVILAANGFFAGCVLMIKYNMLGFWFGFMAAYFFVAVFALCKVKHAFASCFVFLGGMALSSVPWVIYFAVKGALHEFIETYFIINITAYPKAGKLSMLLTSPAGFLVFTVMCGIVGAAVFAGMLNLMIFKEFAGKAKRAARLSYLSVIVFGIMLSMTTRQSAMVYYYEIFMPFIVPLFIAPCFIIDALLAGKDKCRNVTCAVSSLAAVCIMMALTLVFNANYNCRRFDKSELPQYRLAKYINMSENPSLLNYGSLDGGFFLASGDLPELRFFEYQNIPYENFKDCKDEQNRYLEEGIPDYVIVRAQKKTSTEVWQELDGLRENYTFLAGDELDYCDNDLTVYEFKYYLYVKA